MTSASSPASSANGFRTGIAAIVVQFGLAMMPLGMSRRASALASGTTSGTAGSIRHADELSITRQPAAAILGLAFMASVARLTRTSMLEVIREDFMRTARAKGLRSRDVILKHGLRNALIPVITLSSLQFATVLGGTVIIESIFSLPGLGSMVIRSITVRDFPLLQGFVVLMVVVYVTVNLAIDVFASLLDPRIRLD